MSELFLQVWEKVSSFKSLLINCLVVFAKIVYQDSSLQGWEFQITKGREFLQWRIRNADKRF